MNLITESIGEISEQIRTGKTPPTKISEYFEGTYNWYTPGDFSEALLLDSSARFISEKAITENKASIFEINTVLISCIGEIGKIGVLQRKSSCNQQITGITLKPHVDPVYFAYWCKANKDIFKNRARNAVVPILNNALLSSILVTFPEQLDDQKRIAYLLGKVEGLIARRKQHLRQLDDLLKSVFLEMFGDPVRNEKGWNKKKISEIATVKIGPFGSLLHAEDYISGGIPLINPSHIVDGEIQVDDKLTITDQKYHELSAYHLSINDVVIARRGEIGRCALVRTDKKLLCGTGSMFVRITGGYSPVLLQFLIFKTSLKSFLDSKAKGVTMKNINSSILENVEVINPASELQNQFATIVEKVESLKSRYQQSLTDLENLYGALSQQAFKGELDLSRVPLPPDFLSACKNKQDEAVAPIKSDIPKGIKIKLEGLNALNEKATGLKDIARAARASSLIDSKQFDLVKQAAAQLTACHSPIEQLKNMSGIASAMEQLESTIKPLNLSQYDSIVKTAELARNMASSISKSDLSWLDQQGSAALKYANAPFESMRSAMEKIESLNYRQADSIAKNIGLANNLRVSDLHDDTLRNSASVSSSIAGLESLQREQLESARRAQSALDYSTIAPKFNTSISRAYLDAQKATLAPLADMYKDWSISKYTQHLDAVTRIQNIIPDFTTWQQRLASDSLINYFDNEENYDRPLFYAEDLLDILSNATEPLSFESLIGQLNELATVDFVGYETIKTILFGLLAENQIKQTFDLENQILLFSIVENGSEQ